MDDYPDGLDIVDGGFGCGRMKEMEGLERLDGWMNEPFNGCNRRIRLGGWTDGWLITQMDWTGRTDRLDGGMNFWMVVIERLDKMDGWIGQID